MFIRNRDGHGPDGRRLYFFDMGGDAPDPPDYSALARASERSAEIMAELGHDQLDETKRQYENSMAVAKPVIEAQTAIMQQSKEQGDDYYNYNKETFRPLEKSIVQDANDFSEAGAKENFARTAAADLEQQQANERAQSDRSMAAMGVNPNSGRFSGQRRAETIVNAAQRAGAETGARVKADALATAKKMDAAGLGRNLPGASSGAYSVATGAGSAAVGNQTAVSGQLLGGMGASAGLVGRGLGMQQQGLSTIAGLQSNNYNAALSADAQSSAGMGAMLGTIGGIAGSFAFSSKKLKENGHVIDGEAVLEKMDAIPVDGWKYKEGVSDGGEHIGPYAEDMNKQFGDEVAPGGKMIDMVSANGLNMAAIKALKGRLDRLESRYGMGSN